MVKIKIISDGMADEEPKVEEVHAAGLRKGSGRFVSNVGIKTKMCGNKKGHGSTKSLENNKVDRIRQLVFAFEPIFYIIKFKYTKDNGDNSHRDTPGEEWAKNVCAHGLQDQPGAGEGGEGELGGPPFGAC